jgi:hypothetical protein
MRRAAALAALSRDHHALPAAGGVDGAHELGQLLHDHVRYGGRHLFALLEERLPEDELARLGDAIARAETTG